MGPLGREIFALSPTSFSMTQHQRSKILMQVGGGGVIKRQPHPTLPLKVLSHNPRGQWEWASVYLVFEIEQAGL